VDTLEKAAQESLRLNHILLLSNILLILEKAKDLEEAKGQIKLLLTFYTE
jgi:hypothetical protein